MAKISVTRFCGTRLDEISLPARITEMTQFSVVQSKNIRLRPTPLAAIKKIARRGVGYVGYLGKRKSYVVDCSFLHKMKRPAANGVAALVGKKRQVFLFIDGEVCLRIVQVVECCISIRKINTT